MHHSVFVESPKLLQPKNLMNMSKQVFDHWSQTVGTEAFVFNDREETVPVVV